MPAKQGKSKQKIMTRMTRPEAVAYLAEVLMGRSLPFRPGEYEGGVYQILSDAICVSKDSIENYAARGRRTLPIFKGEAEKLKA